jgi:hypothetical protein
MANNIQIVGDILNTEIVSRYSTQDAILIESQEIQENFGAPKDYIEYYVYDAGGNLLDLNYNYRDFKLPIDSSLSSIYTVAPNPKDNITNDDLGLLKAPSPVGSSYPVIEIDPIVDLQNLGYNSGEFAVRYNFFTNKVSSPEAQYFIKRISSDRTELSISSTVFTNLQIEADANVLFNEISGSAYYVNYLLNFGLNQQVVAVNVALNRNDAGYEILFKLYEPLPALITEKTYVWVVSEKISPYIFNINLDVLLSPPSALMLRGANFNIPVETNTISTQYTTYSDLVSTLQVSQSASYNKLLNALTSQSIDINVDYTNYSNFSFFGSVEQRLTNFYTKAKRIEDYNNLITKYTVSASLFPNLQTEINTYSSSISNIIANFDGYETYLYFESSSYAWPKSTTTLPYTLYSTGSATAITWYNTNIALASSYDELNPNNLKNSIPVYLVDNPDNSQYVLFLNMVGHYFDNIWILLQSITDINLANNNLEEGVSKDLVYHVLKSFGINVYNSLGGEDLNQFAIGNNSGSAVYSGSLENFSPTSSYLNNIPRKDLLAEVYKRIYHNLPYLVKTKGTKTGLEAIITTFGITGSILSVKEYGGSTKKGLLKGYNDTKVRLVDNNATGSLLSPFISIQQANTASANILDEDLNYVDISFSPQTQIDLYISQSISSSNPTWNIDDYIGDPRQIYSGSYPDLDNQRKIYFSQGTGSYAGFTGSLLDYNGFIRLIQFFDNSLFKTLGDFIPARTSLSTGITINSPVLERNKFTYANPSTSTTESIHTGEFNTFADESGSLVMARAGSGGVYEDINPASQSWVENINTTKGLVTKLHNDLSEFYTGELSGSTVIVTTQDLVVYEVDANPLFNNVSSSVTSRLRSNIYTPNSELINRQSTTSIFTPAELQDSNLSLTSYKRSRYDGVKTISAEYNTVSSSNQGYGSTAAIDVYTNYFAVFNYITSSYSQIAIGSTAQISELIDVNGNRYTLGENRYVSEVSNTFNAGSDVVLYYINDSSSLSTPKTVTCLDAGNNYITIISSLVSGSIDGAATSTQYYGYITSGSDKVRIQLTGSTSSTITEYFKPVTTTTELKTFMLNGTETGDAEQPFNWLYPFLTSSFSGSLITDIEIANQGNYPPPNGISGSSLTDNTTQTRLYPSESTLVSTANIYSTVEPGDFIVLGTETGILSSNPTNTPSFKWTPGVSGSISYMIISSSFSGLQSGSLFVDRIIPINTIPTFDKQCWLIYRRIPNDTIVLLPVGLNNERSGLIIPKNFNPAYSPLEIARRAGIL